MVLKNHDFWQGFDRFCAMVSHFLLVSRQGGNSFLWCDFCRPLEERGAVAGSSFFEVSGAGVLDVGIHSLEHRIFRIFEERVAGVGIASRDTLQVRPCKLGANIPVGYGPGRQYPPQLSASSPYHF